MKKITLGCVVLLLAVLTVSCGTSTDTILIPPEEYDALNEKYVLSPFWGMILSESWTDANEIDANGFIYFYADNIIRGGDDLESVYIPAEDLEPMVQSHFDITAEHLRTAEYYIAEDNTYEFGGLGGATDCELTGAQKNGELLTLQYQFIGPMGYVTANGELAVEEDGESYVYISNSIEWSAQYHLAFPSCEGEVDEYKVFMFESGGRSSTSDDGVNFRDYDGHDLSNIIAYYENEALPALEAQGSADTGKHEDGWYWSGTYRDGRPLTVDVQRKYGADSYIITAMYDEESNSIVAENMLAYDFMQPPDINDFSELYDYWEKPFYAGILDSTWDDAGNIDVPNLVAFYALGLNDGGDEGIAETSFPGEAVESYMQRYFDISTDSLRRWNVYDDAENVYTYTPEDRTEVCNIVSATSFGAEDGEPVKIVLAYEVTPSEEDATVLRHGELTIELSMNGYKYVGNMIRVAGVIGVDEPPENLPENQAYADKYIYPFNTISFLDRSFSPGNMDELLGTGEYALLKTIFNVLYNQDNPGRELTDYEVDIPQDVFEGTLMNHLDLTPEQIRTDCAEFYNEEKKIYTASFGLGGVGGIYVITDSSMDGNNLTLTYDVYGNDWYGISGYQWIVTQQGTMQIEIRGNSYKYISNTVRNGPGIQ